MRDAKACALHDGCDAPEPHPVGGGRRTAPVSVTREECPHAPAASASGTSCARGRSRGSRAATRRCRRRAAGRRDPRRFLFAQVVMDEARQRRSERATGSPRAVPVLRSKGRPLQRHLDLPRRLGDEQSCATRCRQAPAPHSRRRVQRPENVGRSAQPFAGQGKIGEWPAGDPFFDRDASRPRQDRRHRQMPEGADEIHIALGFRRPTQAARLDDASAGEGDPYGRANRPG